MGVFVEFIQRRLHQTNNSFNCAIVGTTGSGKSYSSLSLAEQIDPNFDVNKNVLFKVEEFLRMINRKKLKRGSAIIFDEAGVALGSRNWQSIYNKAIGLVLQTCRSRGYFICLNVPSYKFLDVQARDLVHGIFNIMKINYAQEVAIMKPLMTQFNPQSGKVYTKYLRTRMKGGKITPVKRILVKKPSEEVIKVYEELKYNFQTELYKDLEQQIERDRKKRLKKLELFTCNQCGYRWIGDRNAKNLRCPKCMTRRWNKPNLKGIPVENLVGGKK